MVYAHYLLGLLVTYLTILLKTHFSIDLVGNFHPLLVHLPIGIFIFGFGLELFSRWKKLSIPSYIQEFILLSATFFSVLSIASGLILGNGGGYDLAALNLHRNMGIGFAIGSLILFLIYKHSHGWIQKTYLPLYGVLVLILSITGHFGGNLTHGEGFLFGPKSAEEVSVNVENIEEAFVYEDLVAPIFEAKCLGCHNNTKTEGGLLMTSREMLIKGGEHGSIFPDKEDSIGTLASRINLDLADKLHMPPKSKVQLSKQEIGLLDWWIKNKHCFECQVNSLPRDENTGEILVAFEKKDSPIDRLTLQFDQVPKNWIRDIQSIGISVYPIAAQSPLLIVNVKGKKDLKRSDFKLLKKYGKQIVELNLSHSNMNDTLAAFLPEFENLLKLQLPQTQITDKSLDYLTSLKYLNSFNAFNTDLSAAALNKISQFEQLKKAYLIDTQIPLDDLAEFNAQNDQIQIEYIGPETFAQTSLDPPKIVTKTDFFKTELEVSLAYVFEDADLYYTLDGSIPDTLSTLYKKPFTIRSSSQLKAITHMKGWGMSEVAQADFKKSALDFEDVSLLGIPNEKYSAQGGKSLVDLKRGSTNFVDGMWLGFEGTHTGANMTLKKSETIKSVSVGALSAPASWIFFPAAIEVYTSKNGAEFKLVGKKSYKPIAASNDISKKFFDISIPETKTKHIKVVIKSPLKNPDWHPNPGGKSWVFVDEIILE